MWIIFVYFIVLGSWFVYPSWIATSCPGKSHAGGVKSFFKLNLKDSDSNSSNTLSEKKTIQDTSTTEVSFTKEKIQTKTKSKIPFMERLIELDNLSKSLLILYETTQNPTITELAKVSGTSRIMTSFSLRKYVKNGVIELDGDNIQFLD